MTVFEYARREEKRQRFEQGLEELLSRPTPPKDGLEAAEEIADVLVNAALLLREAAALARLELRAAREEAA